MYIPAPTEGNFTPCPAGTHLAICTRVIDVGTQTTAYNGEKKTAHKIMLTWEIPEERMEDGRPFTISQFYTWSMHEKSTLRKHLEAWRGLAFTEKDFGDGGFDIRNVLGKSCTLAVVEAQKGDRTYSNISAVGKVMKGMTAPPPVNEQLYLWIHPDRWDGAVLSKLSQGIQGKIIASPEYQKLMAISKGAGSDDSGYHNPTREGFDDDIPF